ncbi:MAG: hypothetical protein R3F30_04045 [Planctomycetota bacterium]
MDPSRSLAPLYVLALTGIGLAGFATFRSLDRAGPAPVEPGIGSRADTDLTTTLEDLRAGQQRFETGLDRIRDRLSELELQVSSRTELGGPSDASGQRGATGDGAAPDAPKALTPEQQERREKEFRDLLGRVFQYGNPASEDEQARFWKLARETGMLDDAIKELADAVEQNPNDPDRRMELASAYVAKLLTVPDGPERGIYGMKAMRQWGAILEKDPNHWESQYSIAFSYSQYPEFMNMTPKAIEGFEKARAIQERSSTQKDGWAETYVQLGLLYKKQDKLDKAIEILTEGNRRFPKNERIQDLLNQVRGG